MSSVSFPTVRELIDRRRSKFQLKLYICRKTHFRPTQVNGEQKFSNIQVHAIFVLAVAPDCFAS